MIKSWTFLAVCVLASPLAVGAQEDEAPAQEHSEHEQHAASPVEPEAGGDSTAAMHEHMRKMREQMASVDPVERQRLMHEHMQSMQQHMQMMGSTRAGPQAGSGSRCAEGDAPCRMDEMQAENGIMRQRMVTLEQRLGSMQQQLMREMMDHLRQAQNGDSGRP